MVFPLLIMPVLVWFASDLARGGAHGPIRPRRFVFQASGNILVTGGFGRQLWRGTADAQHIELRRKAPTGPGKLEFQHHAAGGRLSVDLCEEDFEMLARYGVRSLSKGPSAPMVTRITLEQRRYLWTGALL